MCNVVDDQTAFDLALRRLEAQRLEAQQVETSEPDPEPAAEPEAPDGCRGFCRGEPRNSSGCYWSEWTPRCSGCALYSRDAWLLEQEDCREWCSYECEQFIRSFGLTLADDASHSEIVEHATRLLHLLRRIITAERRRAALKEQTK